MGKEVSTEKMSDEEGEYQRGFRVRFIATSAFVCENNLTRIFPLWQIPRLQSHQLEVRTSTIQTAVTLCLFGFWHVTFRK